jgi:antitoxin (DNA-binding transcriptional repressor) of toxin-antitoxin stability system
MKALNISEVRMHLPALIEGVAHNQEPIMVMRYGAPLAMIVPVTPDAHTQTRYPLRGRPITVADDFDTPMPDLWNALGGAEQPPANGRRKA